MVPPIDSKYSPKNKTGNAVKPILKTTNVRFRLYVGNGTSDTQNNLQRAKNRTANGVKTVSKTANERFRSYYGNCTSD